MTVRLSVLLLAFMAVIAQAQSALPPDIHPVTLSRLPPVTLEDLDEEGQKALQGTTPGAPGPGRRTSRATAPTPAVSRIPRA
jgi:hypothetical protein